MLGPIVEPHHQNHALSVEVTLLFDRVTIADIRRLSDIAEHFDAADEMAAELHYAEPDDREPDGISFAFPIVADL